MQREIKMIIAAQLKLSETPVSLPAQNRDFFHERRSSARIHSGRLAHPFKQALRCGSASFVPRRCEKLSSREAIGDSAFKRNWTPIQGSNLQAD
jgi:hypothetical protein